MVYLITAIHCVSPFIFTGDAKDVTRNDSKTPDPDEDDDQVYSSLPEDWILMGAMVGGAPCKSTFLAHLVPANTQCYGT